MYITVDIFEMGTVTITPNTPTNAIGKLTAYSRIFHFEHPSVAVLMISVVPANIILLNFFLILISHMLVSNLLEMIHI